MMNTAFFLLLLFFQQASATDFLYQKLEYREASCYPFDSCIPSRKNEYDHLWGNYTCECGYHCTFSNTCCLDSPNISKLYHWTQHAEESCMKVNNFHDSVLLVSSCAQRWQHETTIKNKCENSIDISDPFETVPVTNLNSHKTYKNYFCAVCNYDVKNIFIWNIELGFKDEDSGPILPNMTDKYILDNLIYDKKTKLWGVLSNNSKEFHEIKLQLKLPSFLKQFVKKCYTDMIEQCNFLTTRHVDLEQKCLSYYAPIRLRMKGDLRWRKYRNMHCALCNNMTISDIDIITCKLEIVKRRTKPTFSFALLLDINRSDGDVVGQVQFCRGNEKWDPFFKKCRSLACALPGYVIRNGSCVTI